MDLDLFDCHVWVHGCGLLDGLGKGLLVINRLTVGLNSHLLFHMGLSITVVTLKSIKLKVRSIKGGVVKGGPGPYNILNNENKCVFYKRTIKVCVN